MIRKSCGDGNGVSEFIDASLTSRAKWSCRWKPYVRALLRDPSIEPGQLPYYAPLNQICDRAVMPSQGTTRHVNRALERKFTRQPLAQRITRGAILLRSLAKT